MWASQINAVGRCVQRIKNNQENMQTKAASTLSALQVFELDRRSSPVRNTKK